MHPIGLMNGEGTGGGGALILLLALWIAAIVFIVSQDPFGSDDPVASDPTPTPQPSEIVTPDPTPEPTPTPAPPLPECDGAECDAVVTRAELAAAFARAFRLPPTTIDYFTDDADVSQEPAINRVAAAGITSGCDEDRFCPDGEVTRGQFATFLHRAMDLPEADRDYFTDDDDLVHEGAINRLGAAGITSGCGEDRYCPDGNVTLRQLITFLERAFAMERDPAG